MDCTTLMGVEQQMCQYIVQQLAQENFVCNGSLEYVLTLGDGSLACLNYTSPVEKVTGMLGNQDFISSGNAAWVLIGSALVMIMTPGVGLFYGGLAGEESVGNTLMMSFGAMMVVTVQWFLFGYSFAFGPGSSSMGSFEWGAYFGVGANPSGSYGVNIQHLCYAVFQLQFAQITPALISGAVIGRMKFTSYLIFIAIWTTIVYDPLAHWVWSLTINPETGTSTALGWLGVLGALDFAGGTVIHISSGSAALAAALVLGKRYNHREELKPHNVPMVVIGGTLLWFGWFGFNSGSAGAANNPAGTAFFNTHLATAASTISWAVTERIFAKKITATGAMAGAVAGLVAITPACGFVDVWAALVIGLVVSPVCYGAAKAKTLIGVDDTLDSFAVHAVGGAVGAFCTGIFASPNVNSFSGAIYGFPMQLGFQMAAICTAFIYSFVLTYILLEVMKRTIGVRVSDEIEQQGIDLSEHGGKAYQ